MKTDPGFLQALFNSAVAALVVVVTIQVWQAFQEQAREERLNRLLTQLRLDRQIHQPPELVNPKVARALRSLDPLYSPSGTSDVSGFGANLDNP